MMQHQTTCNTKECHHPKEGNSSACKPITSSPLVPQRLALSSHHDGLLTSWQRGQAAERDGGYLPCRFKPLHP
jgi:hypothetical protein